MSLMKILIPVGMALLAWGAVMAVSGLRQNNRLKLFSAAGAFALFAAGALVLMEFITRPL